MTDFETMCRNFSDEQEAYTRRCVICGSEFTYNHQYGAQKQKCDECAKRRSTYKKVGRSDNNPVVVVGYLQDPRIPKEEYDDYYIGQTFPFEEVELMVKMGSFTPGIVLQRKGTRKVVVVKQGLNQEVRVI